MSWCIYYLDRFNTISTINPLSYVSTCSIYIPLITEDQRRKLILSLKNSSAGWDVIPASIVKQ